MPYTQFLVASYEIEIVSHLNSIKNVNIRSHLFQNSTVESGSQTQMCNKSSVGSDFVTMQKA